MTKRHHETPPNPFSDGMFVVVDKPKGWTSFDVVNRFRWLLCRALGIKRIKVGHAGTLDPLATGLVVLCTGKYTKRIEEVQLMPKTYETTLHLGATTPSYDLETEVDSRHPYEHITEQMIREVLEGFVGSIRQVPPLFSAVNVGGTRAYELARKGSDLELPAKEVMIHDIKIKRVELPEVELEVTCGKGTYIRSLARDIGRALGSGAHLTMLRRTKVGSFDVEGGLVPEDFENYIQNRLNQQDGTTSELNNCLLE